MLVQPYLVFEGRCEEAIEFYRKAVGAEVLMKLRFKDQPDPKPGTCPSGNENNIMHAALKIGSTTIFASDGRGSGHPKFEGFNLSVTVANEAEADRAFAALGAGGKVTMPLAKTFFSPKFGMLTDKFGVSWMVLVRPEQA